MQRLGRDCSMLVYILHPVVWHTLDGVYLYLGITDNLLAQYLRPLLVVVFSILLALLFNAIVAKIKTLKIASKTA